MQHALHTLYNRRFARFLLAGGVNTAVNFIVLNVSIYGLHLHKILASVLATCTAIACGFMLNRSFVFGDRNRTGIKLVRFMAISVAGVLLIQTSVYAACLTVLTSIFHDQGYLGLTANIFEVNASNLAGSIAVMLWNYTGYRLWVFTDSSLTTTEEKDHEF